MPFVTKSMGYVIVIAFMICLFLIFMTRELEISDLTSLIASL